MRQLRGLPAFTPRQPDDAAPHEDLPVPTGVDARTVSICVVLKNRFPLFSKCLDSLMPWFRRDANCDLVVADFHSDDCNLEREIDVRRLRATILPVDGQFTRARGRNAAAAAATGEILVFIDADMLLPPTFGAYVRSSVRVGQVAFPECFMLREGRPAVATPDNGDWGGSAYGNMAVTKIDFEAVGDWHEPAVKWGSEDDEMFRRYRDRGLRIIRTRPGNFFHQWHDRALRNRYTPEGQPRAGGGSKPLTAGRRGRQR